MGKGQGHGRGLRARRFRFDRLGIHSQLEHLRPDHHPLDEPLYYDVLLRRVSVQFCRQSVCLGQERFHPIGRRLPERLEHPLRIGQPRLELGEHHRFELLGRDAQSLWCGLPGGGDQWRG